jgi:protein O-mannosyl-transferase
VRRFLSHNLTRGLLLVVLTFIAYTPALRSGFVWDDAEYIRDNPLIKASDGLRRFWCTTEFPDYYALSNTSFWLEWRLWGNNPAGYHAVNILLHAANALLIWILLQRLGIPAAWMTAVVFALHPINVMSVAWISERKNLLALLFTLLAALAFLRWDDAGKHRWYGLAIGTFALSLLSKTAVVMFPAVLLLFVWWRRDRVNWRQFIATIPFFALSLVMGLVTIWFERQHGIINEVVRAEGVLARLLGAAWAIWFYIGKTLWPVNLAVIYPRWQIDVGTVAAWIPLLALVAIVVACWKFRATWGRGVLFALGCFAAMLFPVLGFFNVAFMAYSFVADHWLYFSLTPIIALACTVAAKQAKCWNIESSSRIVAPAVTVVLMFWTWQRTNIWRNEEMLWRDTLAKNPAAWMAHNNLGNTLLAQGHAEAAVAEYRETIRLKPDYGNAHYNLGIVCYQRRDYDEAVNQFGEAARLKPRSAEAHNNLGAALVNVGRTNDAVIEFELAAKLAPRWDEPRANLARLH